MSKFFERFHKGHSSAEGSDDINHLMRRFDKESNTRVWTGWRKTIIKYIFDEDRKIRKKEMGV